MTEDEANWMAESILGKKAIVEKSGSSLGKMAELRSGPH
jgi:hypothetical protein